MLNELLAIIKLTPDAVIKVDDKHDLLMQNFEPLMHDESEMLGNFLDDACDGKHVVTKTKVSTLSELFRNAEVTQEQQDWLDDSDEASDFVTVTDFVKEDPKGKWLLYRIRPA